MFTNGLNNDKMKTRMATVALRNRTLLLPLKLSSTNAGPDHIKNTDPLFQVLIFPLSLLFFFIDQIFKKH